MSYNGWNNYATFRVHNDILNGIAFEDTVSIDDLKEIVTETVKEAITLQIEYNLSLIHISEPTRPY